MLAGSVARGAATPASDIDLVLVFERVGNAWRETVTINGIAVEIFAHDPETLATGSSTRIARPAPGRSPPCWSKASP